MSLIDLKELQKKRKEVQEIQKTPIKTLSKTPSKTFKADSNNPTYEDGFADGVSHAIRAFEKLNSLLKLKAFKDIEMYYKEPPDKNIG